MLMRLVRYGGGQHSNMQPGRAGPGRSRSQAQSRSQASRRHSSNLFVKLSTTSGFRAATGVCYSTGSVGSRALVWPNIPGVLSPSLLLLSPSLLFPSHFPEPPPWSSGPPTDGLSSRFLKLMLGVAVTCSNKQTFIDKIQVITWRFLNNFLLNGVVSESG